MAVVSRTVLLVSLKVELKFNLSLREIMVASLVRCLKSYMDTACHTYFLLDSCIKVL